ncbi:LamG-like jellyroll fold domain-containing protein [Flavobacterium caseinilyticum]|uniref:MAM protein n=1 Tax=Flavobacterium caseinilyticum TaxID=2541732 RepID=A0A4R5B3I6_9FLAO|nr:LamG-like jellyroll fold domain-containing protein [Flavobacterium caseinilyticum]TDD78786.1 MAM protein [Flavobacterium caseinilyticum]
MTAQTKVAYTSSGTWTCPAGVTSITVEAWGAGGGGTIGAAAKGYTGGGGGGGAYAKLNTVTVTPGTVYNFTVGGASTYNNDGATTTGVFGGQTIKAVGGSKGGTVGLISVGGVGGDRILCLGDVRFSGGNGGTSNGDSSGPGAGAGGGGGGGAGSTANGANGNSALNTSTGGAAGAATNFNGGAGGDGGNSRNAGQPGSTSGFGGGGGGSGDLNGAGFVTRAGGGQNGAIIITLILPYGPGGVTSNLQLWLRSDLLDGTTSVADNTAVGTWKTQALGDNAINPLTLSAPIYRNNVNSNINFNSVVDFTNTTTNLTAVFNNPEDGRKYLKGAKGFYSQEMFVVTIPNSPVSSATRKMDLFCGDNSGLNDYDDTGIGFGNYTPRWTNEAITYATGTSSGYSVVTANSHNVAAIISARNNSAATAQELYYNGSDLTPLSSGTFSNVTNSQYWIGRSKAYTGNLDARVAEVITYDSRATNAERSNIRSYLAIKYGITLGVNGTSMNYTNSSGTAIWDATATGYNYDITGIGRDDITKLTQRQSKSINTTDDITIGLGTIAATNTANTNNFNTDKTFLVWGNNQGALTAQSVVVNISSGITSPAALVTDVSYKTIIRKWKVVETGGDISTCKISIPTSMLASTNTPAVTPGDYMMFISNSPTFDSTAETRIMTVNGSNLETNYNFDGTKYITFGFAPERTFERCIQFDGINDYLDSGNVLNLNNSFTVSAWINSTRTNQTILSKRNSAFTQGYDLSINSAGKAEMSWFVGGVKKIITSYAVIPLGIWHHIGVTFDGITAKMYIDGVNRISLPLDGTPTATTNSFLIGAADGISKTSFFKGSIDEVRIWKVALTAAQFRYVMNQEIVSNATFTNGVVVPNTITLNDIRLIPWADLNAYYPMSTYSFTNAKDNSSYGLTAALRNINTVDLQTAPLPYESAGTGNWETVGIWKNSTFQDLPNSVSIEDPTPSGVPPPGLSFTVDWNIVKVKDSHKVTSIGNKKFLGLIVEPTAKLIATTSGESQTDGTKIEVSHYLRLDGQIDLVGRSQLVQTEGSDLEVASNGFIERDQQGQKSIYNYNYWSSPVGAINNTTNNNSFTVKSVLRDGTIPAAPVAINWTSGYNGKPGPPISLAGYWIFKFDNKPNAYASWTQLGENGLLSTGKGFTLKGSGATTANQNYTFVGKPNNGTITISVGAGQTSLIGNPYSSALDANAFLNANKNYIDGAIYFWEHFDTNTSHNLASYQGGYATRNYTGGTKALALGGLISTSGQTSKEYPNQFIPVGQGFFVTGSATGGSVAFNNSQRAFFKEDNSAASQTMYRIPKRQKGLDHWTDTSDDQIKRDTYKRVRLGYNFTNGYHRQVLLGFMEDKATSGIDYGYDALNADNFPNDMYLLNGDNQLIIQGEGYFDDNASYPIGVKTDAQGKVSFVIDALENFDENQPIFIYDKTDDSYHNIKDTLYEVELPAGTFNDRFALRFTNKTLGTNTFNLSKINEVNVIVNQNVTVQSFNQLIKNITVYDLLGRKIDSYKKVNALKYTLNNLNKMTAGLIVKITLEDNAEVSKKIIY